MAEQGQKVDFSGLVAGLATSAVAVMGQVEGLLDAGGAEVPGEEGAEPLSATEVEKRVSEGLAGVRQLIDTLAVLDEKTRGNLTDEEKELLQSVLSELRIRFVSLSNRPVPSGE